ncbi:MerR family DNA-binding transcriptional regulator [Anaerostipes sp.]|uniref:MerR family DNA-binding transcriptional regulator n=1 Tax=Anaerostipes sp. TaxID=1872530 RepID=UPI0025C5C06D|nr:MerR family DNA-binding transcriptional regulator [Anaerostipes sp.]MBS7007953.1 MerR family DNA-binding transcriptional regulator [Anaerostipes sp.]
MEDYLTIGEVSKMKGVGIKSLRYYDRIGILKPAYINPKTGYRYYAINQMLMVDLILLCLGLDIPLKEMQEYMDEKNHLDVESLLKDGRKKAEEKAAKIQGTLSQIDGLEKRIRGSDEIRKKGRDLYYKSIDKRMIIALPWKYPSADDKAYMSEITKLYSLSQELGLTVFYQQGLIRYIKGTEDLYYIFMEIQQTDIEDPRIFCLPEGTYQCSVSDTTRIEEEHIREEEEEVLIVETDFYFDRQPKDKYFLELQILKREGRGI